MNTGLLSRIAEMLYWTGRYIERADDTARIIDVYMHRILEDPHADEEADCRALLAILGVPSPDDQRPDAGLALFKLAYDARSPSAVTGAVLAARAGVRGVRGVVSSEMWECLNVTWNGLAAQRRSAERLGPHVFLRFVSERAALFFGLADSTMSHDAAWHFLVLGRSLERVDMTSRLLLARVSATQYELGWSMLLRASGAHESFIRTHGWASEPQRVTEFLLLDRLFPRSVMHALSTAEECLTALDPGPERAGDANPARRPIGYLRTRLEYADPKGLADELPELLGALQEACGQASDAITKRYFQYAAPVTWVQEG